MPRDCGSQFNYLQPESYSGSVLGTRSFAKLPTAQQRYRVGLKANPDEIVAQCFAKVEPVLGCGLVLATIIIPLRDVLAVVRDVAICRAEHYVPLLA